MRSLIRMQYAGMDRGPLRALSLILALGLAACVMWQPARFAARTSDIAIWQSALLIWAVCAGVVHGSGLRLQRQRWQLLLAPLPALIVLAAGLLHIGW
ncbi:cyd operon protein YbgE [Candidatus Pantoea soli]|uniref:Cyd operon protein YbgE n=1 Tax=Candidatus Pantoea soli TaxID=3098669 RepID=A0A518XAZ8_9GAMM|nr:cyd operon protein YbgE [Pantoea soli]QDY41361.1 cyd operon protein YbgE [Pantoea soli]